MARFTGARELGIKVEWRLAFVPFGVTVSPLPGVLYIDVGGSVQPGVIDHHQGELEEESASEIVLRQPECSYGHLMRPWLRRAEEGALAPSPVWRPTLVTHFNPDWDAVVACWVVRRLVEDGEFPAAAEALVAYSSEVDQGRQRLDPAVARHLLAPHLGYLAIQNLERDGRRLSSEEQMRGGWELIERIVRDVEGAGHPGRSLHAGDFLPPARGATLWAEDPAYADVRTLLETDLERFETNDRPHAEITTVTLPAQKTGVPLEVSGFILRQPPSSVLHKYWVRRENPLYVCPLLAPRNGVSSRVVISLDPGHRSNGLRPSLRGLGYRLEQEETRVRQAGGRDDRRGRPRFPDGYCSNDDPWYDGRAHGWTIVDSPRAGTRLALDWIIGTTTGGHFWQIPIEEARITMVWLEGAGQRSPGSPLPPPAPFDGMTDGLRSFYQDLDQQTLPGPEVPASIGVSAAMHRRILRCSSKPDFDPALRVLRLGARSVPGQPVTLERLVEHLGTWPRPDYSLARIRLATHFSPPGQEESLLASLVGGVVAPLEGAAEPNVEAFFHSHGLLVRHRRPLPDAAQPDPAEEMLLYVAFAHEAVSRFSERITGLVPSGMTKIRSLDSDALNTLRADFIRFQSRDFTLNVSRLARVQEAFNRVAEAIGLRAHYHEVQSGLDRLAELEAQFAEERLARADTIAQAMLFAIAVAGLLQSVVAVDTWMNPARWPITGGILLLGIAAWGLVERVKRKR